MKSVLVKKKRYVRDPLAPKKLPGRKVAVALGSLQAAINTTTEYMAAMSDRQRKMFIHLSTGKDALQSFFLSGMNEKRPFYTIKIVYLNPKKPKKASDLTLDDLPKLTPESYARLLRFCESEVASMLGNKNYKDYIIDVQHMFALVAPEMMGVLTEVALNPEARGADRVKAATDLLDRAGYEKSQKGQAPIMPVQINIRFDKEAVPEDVPMVEYSNTDNGEV
jgi:hypothetical protein